MTRMEKVLITGADGFVGRAACVRLQALGYEVMRVVRTSRTDDAISVKDLVGFENWERLLRGVDFVIHLAARAHVLNDTAADPMEEFRRVNVTMTLQLARAAAAAGVRKFVFLSTIGVNGNYTTDYPFAESDQPNPSEPYATSKWEAEQGLIHIGGHSDMRITRIRPPLILGPGVKGNLLRLVKLVDRGVPLPFGAIRNSRSFVTLDDLCELLYLCLTQQRADDEMFLAANEEEISTPDLVRAIATGLDREVRLISVPVPILRVATGLVGAGAHLRRMTSSLRVDATRARASLDWKSRTDISDAIISMAQAYLREKKRSDVG
jgi:UDP-N-acetyl-alpha-D-quinovosamine dehydrogenase